MWHFRTATRFVLLAGFIALSQQGCDLKFTVQQQPPAGSYPNALEVQQGVEAEMARINQGLNTGALEPAMAQGLLETDTMVQALSRRYRSANPSGDLDPSQTAFLDALLNGNQLALNDAFENRQDWVYAFNGDLDYDFHYPLDRLLYIVVLQAGLHQQGSDIQAAIQSGNLSPDRAGEARQRLQSVREAEIGDFRQNNALDLSSDQILELQQMADDSGRFIRFLAQGNNNGPWQGSAPASPPASGNGYAVEAFANVQASNPGPASNPPSKGTVSGTLDPAHFRLNRLTPTTAPAMAAPTPVPAAPVNPSLPYHQPPQGAPGALPIPVHAAAPAATPVPQPRSSQPGNGAASTAPPPAVSYVSADSLKARDKKLDQLLDAVSKLGKGNSARLADAGQKRKAFHNALKTFLAQNQQKGLTQDQANQLSKMLDDFAKSVTGLPSPQKP